MVPINLVVAEGRDHCIGKGGRLPWERIPADMKHFYRLTFGHVVVMGRSTWESIGSKPLSGRYNVVLSRNRDFSAPGILVLHSSDHVRYFTNGRNFLPSKRVFVIGGAEIYKEFLPDAVRIYTTIIDKEFGGADGDVYFPEFDRNEWKETARRSVPCSSQTPHHLDFVTLERAL